MSEYAYDSVEKPWDAPKNLNEAEAKRQKLKFDLLNVEHDLSCKNATTENGRRMSLHDYHDWRDELIGEKHAILFELDLLKKWIREEKSKVFKGTPLHAKVSEEFDENNPCTLLQECIHAFKELVVAEMMPPHFVKLQRAIEGFLTRGRAAGQIPARVSEITTQHASTPETELTPDEAVDKIRQLGIPVERKYS